MMTCTLGEKKYAADFISGRGLREMEPDAKMYSPAMAIAYAAMCEILPDADQLTIPRSPG